MFYEIPLYVTFSQSFFGSIVLCTLVYISTKSIFPQIENSTATLACSTVHAILSSYWSISSWIYHWDNLMVGSASLITGSPRHHDYMLCSFTAGYMIFDTIICAIVDYQGKLLFFQLKDTATAVTVVSGNENDTIEHQHQRTLKVLKSKRLFTPEMMLHHFIGLVTTLTGVFSLMVLPYVAMFLLCELSTPFVNFHHLLPSSSPWKIPNGICMFLSFGIVRIGLVSLIVRSSLYSYNSVDENGRKGSEEYPYIFWTLFIVTIPLYGLNIFWFYRIAIGLFHKIREAKLSSSVHSSSLSSSSTITSTSTNVLSSSSHSSVTDVGSIMDISSSPSSPSSLSRNSILIHHSSSPELKKTNSSSNNINSDILKENNSNSSSTNSKNKVK